MTVARAPNVVNIARAFFARMYEGGCKNPGQKRSRKYSALNTRRTRHGNTMLRIPAASMSLLCTCATCCVNVSMWFWRNMYLNTENVAAPYMVPTGQIHIVYWDMDDTYLGGNAQYHRHLRKWCKRRQKNQSDTYRICNLIIIKKICDDS